ncbi:hypothetical protein [Streptomyces sp. NPDC002104]
MTWMHGGYPGLKLDISGITSEGDLVVTHTHLNLELRNPDNAGRTLADYVCPQGRQG